MPTGVWLVCVCVCVRDLQWPSDLSRVYLSQMVTARAGGSCAALMASSCDQVIQTFSVPV